MDFRDLDALHAAHDLAVEIHDVSQSFPADNQFTLGEAICAASLEIPACLADGCGRGDGNALTEAIENATGATARLEYFVLLAGQLGLIDEETLGDLTELMTDLKTELSKAAAK
jgi:four helix bundle protein